MYTPRQTPGPWVAKPHGVVVGGAAISLPRGNVQQQVAMVCTIDDGDRDANARLIASAPDLLAALRNLLAAVAEPARGAAALMEDDGEELAEFMAEQERIETVAVEAARAAVALAVGAA